MICTCQEVFKEEIFGHIWSGRNLEAKSIITVELAKKTCDTCGSLVRHAAVWGNADILQYLINYGANVDCLGLAGKTPLMLAVGRGKVECVKVLLRAEANINIKDANDQTALQLAVSIDIIQAFYNSIKNRSSTINEIIKKLNVAGCTALQAVQLKEEKILKGLLRRGCDINADDRHGKTALHIVAEKNEFEMVKMLISCGANVNVITTKDGKSPLYYAASNANMEMLQLLLEQKADPNLQKANIENTPLFVSFVEIPDKTSEFSEILLNYGAFPESLHSFISTVLKIYSETDENSQRLNCLIAQHAILQMIKTTSAETIMTYNEDQYRREILKLKKYYNMCQKILKIRIFKELMLLDLLTQSDRSMKSLVHVENFMSQVENACFENDLDKIYPYYFNTLSKRIAKIEHRINLENKAILVVCNILKSNYDKCYVAAKKIVDYLCERDLERLSHA